MASYRLKERFVGCQWLGVDTPQEDVDWLKSLPKDDSNVQTISFKGDTLKLTTRMTESELEPGDYIVIGDNKQPLVMPERVFNMRYEVCDG